MSHECSTRIGTGTGVMETYWMVLKNTNYISDDWYLHVIPFAIEFTK